MDGEAEPVASSLDEETREAYREQGMTPEEAERFIARFQSAIEERVSQFREENAALTPEDRPVVFLGDSLTEGFDLARYFPGLHALNRGISGDRIRRTPLLPPNAGIMNRLDESLFNTQAGAFNVLIGTNHMYDEEFDAATFAREYEELLGEIATGFPDVPVILNTVPPFGRTMTNAPELNRRVEESNEEIRTLADQMGHALIDLHALLRDETGYLAPPLTYDGVHFTDPAYERWAEALHSTFEEQGIAH